MAQVGSIQNPVAGLCCTAQRPVVGCWCCLAGKAGGLKQKLPYSLTGWFFTYRTNLLIESLHLEPTWTNLQVLQKKVVVTGPFWVFKKLHRIHLMIWLNGNIRIYNFPRAQDTTGGVRIFTMEAAESSSRVLDRKVLGGGSCRTVLFDQELDDLWR